MEKHYNNRNKENSYKTPGLRVEVGENFGAALRKFKKKVDDSGILIEYMKNQYFEKPSVERKRKRGAAIARYKKKLRNKLDSL